MPIYKVELRDGTPGVADEIVVPDRTHALQYAQGVVRELMACNEAQTRWWRLDVYDNDHKIAEIPFVSLGDTFNYLRPESRATVTGLCDRLLSLHETIASAHITLRESRALVARSRGRPYLVAEGGEPTIREPTLRTSACSASKHSP
jgi:hypothetical protein